MRSGEVAADVSVIVGMGGDAEVDGELRVNVPTIFTVSPTKEC